MSADIHGGHVPCEGAYIIVDTEVINALAKKTPQPDRRPPVTDASHDGGGSSTTTNPERQDGIRLWE